MTPTPSRIMDPQPAEPREPTLLDSATVVLRRWKTILLVTLLFTSLAALVAFTSGRTWTAKLVLVPSSSGGDSRMQMLASQLAIPGLAGRLGSLGGSGSGQTVVAAIVNSKALRDSVSHAVRAAGHTDMDKKKLDKLLKSGTTVDTDPVDRSITIEVTAKDPQLAQRLAAQFPQAVNSIATAIAIEAAAHKRETVERQIEVARTNLQRSQQALLEYQERTGTPQIQEQARQTVAAAAELQRTITQQEARVAQLRRVATADNPDYQAAVAQLGTLRAQLRRLTTEGGEVFLSKGSLPTVQLELARRLRDYTKDEQIYTTLTAELVEAQMDLGDNLEVVSVLDAPELPDRPAGPRRGLLLVLGMMVGGMAGLFIAYTAEYISAARRTRPDEPFFVEWDRIRGARAGNGTHAGTTA